MTAPKATPSENESQTWTENRHPNLSQANHPATFHLTTNHFDSPTLSMNTDRWQHNSVAKPVYSYPWTAKCTGPKTYLLNLLTYQTRKTIGHTTAYKVRTSGFAPTLQTDRPHQKAPTELRYTTHPTHPGGDNPTPPRNTLKWSSNSAVATRA